MFEELSQRFEDAVRGLKGEASISEGNVDSALKGCAPRPAGRRRQPAGGQKLHR